jgi:hypothetical protein
MASDHIEIRNQAVEYGEFASLQIDCCACVPALTPDITGRIIVRSAGDWEFLQRANEDAVFGLREAEETNRNFVKGIGKG